MKTLKAVKAALPLAIMLALPSVANAATPGWYTGARIGGSTFHSACDVAGQSCDKDSAPVGGVFAGYQQNDYFSIEGGYTYLGEASLAPAAVGQKVTSYDAKALDLVGKLQANLSDSFDVYAKAGVAMVRVNANGANLDETDNGLSPTVGAGLEYYFDPSLSMGLDYQVYFDAGDDSTGVSEIHLYTLNMTYHFGEAQAPVPVAEPEPVVMTKVINPVAVTVHFATDSEMLTPATKAELDPVIARLKANDEYQLRIAGNTDSTGSEAYNAKLSEKRAQSVADAIAAEYNVDPARLIVEGKGELNPVASNATAEGRAQNRRVDIYVPRVEIQETKVVE